MFNIFTPKHFLWQLLVDLNGIKYLNLQKNLTKITKLPITLWKLTWNIQNNWGCFILIYFIFNLNDKEIIFSITKIYSKF